MKFLLAVLPLLAGRLVAQPGLVGTYYAGTNFERKILTRPDPQPNFDWSGQSPAAGMPSSYYSVRWTGKILAPATGQYRFYAKVDDGIRIWINNQKIMDSWQLNDSQDFTGSIVLEAGRYYDLRIDYFNDILGGKIAVYWQRPDARPGTSEPVAPRYFVQKAPVVVPPAPLARLPRTVSSVAPPPPVPKPAMNPEIPRRQTGRDSLKGLTTIRQPITSTPPTNIEPDTTFNLRRRVIPFSQSSYEILPESALELDQLVLVLKKHPDWCIRVAGYTDNVGDPRLNLVLSEYRARVVAYYLIRRGISSERITPGGYGDKQPVTSNKTEEERSENRRVVISRQ